MKRSWLWLLVCLKKSVSKILDYRFHNSTNILTLSTSSLCVGKEGRDIAESDAFDYIFGYTIANDVTARDLQKRHMQFFKGMKKILL
jgi:hypothetical protein